jgi:hypothetical protein
LVADEDLGKQSIVNWGRRKSWMRNRKWRSVLSATYVLNSTRKPPLELARQRPNKQRISLFECFVTGPARAKCKQHYLHEDRLDMLEVGRALISSAARRSSSAAVAAIQSTLSCSGLVRSAKARSLSWWLLTCFEMSWNGNPSRTSLRVMITSWSSVPT